MPSRRLTISAGVSLALGLILALLWVRSYWSEDYLSFGLWIFGAGVESNSGQFETTFSSGTERALFDYHSSDTWEVRVENLWTFAAGKPPPLPGAYGSLGSDFRIAVPHWFVMLLTLILPAVWWRQKRKQAASQ